MEKEWSELSPDERQEERFKQWLSPKGISFKNPEAKRSYQLKVKRLIDAIQLKEPDRIPVALNPGHVPARYSGYTVREVMYDMNKLKTAWQKFIHDFNLDILPSATVVRCGRVLDFLDSKMYKWPGHGLPDDLAAQYVESEYLKADEWDALRDDPSDFQFRTYLPRVYGVAEPFKKLPALSSLGGRAVGFGAFSDPEVQSAFKAFADAGKAEIEWREFVSELDRKGLESGLPIFYGGTVTGMCPFDTIGASLRGTKGTIMDMFRQPEMLLEYMERSVPGIIRSGVAGANANGVPVVFIPLHRGADGFMSEEQFSTFYWPYLKRVITGYIEEGLVPRLFAEGGYNTRLEIISELPKGKVIWHFDKTDMKRAKEVLGGKACIMGNIPTDLMVAGSRDEIRQYGQQLIETTGRSGGYIMAPGATADNAKLDNILTVRETVKEFGVYRK